MTQLEIIKNQLNQYGEVSRNWCLRNYISRLGARIIDLKNEGWKFETKTKDGDYIYKVIKPNEQQKLI